MSIALRRLTGLMVSIGLPLGVLAVLLLGLPRAAQASNLVVNDCTQAGLQAKVGVAHDGDLITFNCTSGNHKIDLTQTLVLTRNITLDGGSVITLTGSGSIRILSISAGHNVTVTNMALNHGFAPEGSAINVFGGIVVDNVTFFDNLAASIQDITGGAISLHNAAATVKNSRFISNSAQSNGFSWGGALGGAGVLTVTNSLFVANRADIGGAIFHDGPSGWIADSTFITNSARIGGALTTIQSLTLLRDEFDLNHTAGVVLIHPGIHLPPNAGGALSIDTGAAVTIQHSLFFSNSASTGIIGRGGAIVSDGDLTVFDTLFRANNASFAGGALLNLATANISFSAFEHNSSAVSSGAISNTAALNVANSTFFSNTSGADGGALDNHGAAQVQSSQFNQNSAVDGGGAFNERGGVLDIGSSTFVSNSAQTGGALRNYAILTVTNSTLTGNFASNAGGALVSGVVGTVKALLVNTTVTSNTTQLGASALALTFGSLTLINTIAGGNTPANCSGAITDGGHNLQFGDNSCTGITVADPHLGPLQDNGGERAGVGLVGLLTRLPLPGSPAINAADGAACPARDERGFLRLAPCDIGAVERVFPLLLPLVRK